jgi:hypothetical protein
MKLAIVREMWTRYTSTITETLEAEIRNFLKNGTDDSNHLNEIIIDKMAELQAANPAFIEIWSCVTASIDLRALNVEDTLHNARAIANALQQRYPECDPSAVFDRALIAIEAASATTRLALTVAEPHRARVLFSLKATLSLLLDPMTLDRRKVYPEEKEIDKPNRLYYAQRTVLHEPLHTLLADADALSMQFAPDAWPAVSSAIGRIHGTNMHQQCLSAQVTTPSHLQPTNKVLVASHTYPQHPALHADRPHTPIASN